MTVINRNTRDFIIRAQFEHNNYYSYKKTKVIYTKDHSYADCCDDVEGSLVSIQCLRHAIAFEESVAEHVHHTTGCPKCLDDYVLLKQREDCIKPGCFFFVFPTSAGVIYGTTSDIYSSTLKLRRILKEKGITYKQKDYTGAYIYRKVTAIDLIKRIENIGTHSKALKEYKLRVIKYDESSKFLKYVRQELDSIERLHLDCEGACLSYAETYYKLDAFKKAGEQHKTRRTDDEIRERIAFLNLKPTLFGLIDADKIIMWRKCNFGQQLSPAVEVEHKRVCVKRPKRPAIEYTVDQSTGIDVIQRFLNDSVAKFCRISGGPGVGKTFLASGIFKLLTDHSVMAAVAPTHKAVKVLKSKLRHGEVCSTIHSFLHLKPVRKGYETEWKQVSAPESHSKLVLLDEYSMVGKNLFKFIQDDAYYRNRKYIFFGDGLQIPPVGEKESPITVLNLGKYSHELNEIVRQEANNPIVRTVHTIRAAIAKGKEPVIVTDMYKGKGVSVLALPEWTNTIRDIADSFTPDIFRIIAYRNSTTKKYNKMVRSMLNYDLNVPFDVGEYVVANDTYSVGFGDDEVVVITNGVEGEVIEMYDCIDPVYRLRYYQVTIKDEEGTIYTVPVLNMHEEEKYYRVKETLLEDAKRDRKKWYVWYKFLAMFCDLRSLFSITSHKCQGSTYQYSFIDYCDIYTNQNIFEADRCMVVAASRATDIDYFLK